ncbi:hypothetical protein ACHAPT_005449 [Fusarium lateritium]
MERQEAASGKSKARARPSPRGTASYRRKRAVSACQVCRARRTKCDNLKPSCSFCLKVGATCIQSPADLSSFDPASIQILERLDVLERLMRGGLPQVPDEQSLEIGFGPLATPVVMSMVQPSTLNHIMSWTCFQDLFISDDQIDDSCFLASPQSCRDAQSSATALSSTDLELVCVRVLADNFFRYVHIKNPIFDERATREIVDSTTLNGIDWSPQSCLALLICALGAIATPFGPSDTTSAAHAKALSYFRAAERRLGVLFASYDLIAPQCLFLAGVFMMCNFEVVKAWRFFIQALAQCQQLKLHPPRAQQQEDAYEFDSLQRVPVYWSAWKSERELRRFLHMADFAASDHKPGLYPSFFPTPPLPRNDGGLSGDYGQVSGHDDEREQMAWYFYLAEISLRRLSARIEAEMEALYETHASSREAFLKAVASVVPLHETQVQAWVASLPACLSFLAPVEQDEVCRFVLRGLAIGLMERLYWPFLSAYLDGFTNSAWLAPYAGLAQKGLDHQQLKLVVNRPGFRHRHHGTDLVSKLTIKEKVKLLAAFDWWRTARIDRDDVFVPHIKLHRQTSDGPNGARGESYVSGITAACFPCSTCVGATFDVDHARRLGQEIANEMKTKSANVLLAPTMNMIRSPLGGRNYETYSEDPFLIGTLAAAFVNGCQGEGIAATPKHFVGNDSEKRRTKMTVQVDKQTLRELYMLPFQLVMRDSDPWCFMTAYNRVNGVYCADSNRLLDRVLRKEWGFSGVVVSDWMGTYSTAAAINAGMDLEMPGPTRWRGEKLLDEVNSGAVPVAAIDRSVERILTLAQRTGRFENPEERPEVSVPDAARWEFIAELAADGAVLLKNDSDILPISRESKLAVVGHFAKNPANALGGGGSAKVHTARVVSPLQALTESGVRCLFAEGVPVHAALPHPPPDIISSSDDNGLDTSPVSLQWFNGNVVGQNKVYEERVPTPEYMIKEAWPKFLDRDYCTRMTFALTPHTTGDHIFSAITTGTARVFIDGIEVFHREQEPVLMPESFYFYKAKIERRFRIPMTAGKTVRVELHSWAADEAVLSSVDGTVFQGSALRFMEYIDVPSAIEHAANTASMADAAVVFIGNTNEVESEGYDRDSMDLAQEQYDLVLAVAARNPRTVVINFSGSPVTVSPFIDKVPSFLQAWFAGQECGYAIAKVLTGDVNPSGRLPLSWPKKNEDNPAYGNFPCDKNDICRYEERLGVGYRFYDEPETPNPQFPFGFGLSYTTFDIVDFKVVSVNLGPPEETKISLAAEVKNTGTRDGKTVVQIYVSYNGCSMNPGGNKRPVKELKAYKKALVSRGERVSVELGLDKYAFSWFDAEQGKWKLQEGNYTIHAAFSSVGMIQSVPVNIPQSYHWSGV